MSKTKADDVAQRKASSVGLPVASRPDGISGHSVWSRFAWRSIWAIQNIYVFSSVVLAHAGVLACPNLAATGCPGNDGACGPKLSRIGGS